MHGFNYYCPFLQPPGKAPMEFRELFGFYVRQCVTARKNTSVIVTVKILKSIHYQIIYYTCTLFAYLCLSMFCVVCFVCIIVPYRDLPKYNPRRRSVISRAFSDPRLNCSMTCLSGRLSRGPPSPCPSNRSLPPFSSASSCLSECSGHTRSGSCSDSSYSGTSSHFGSEDNCGSAITG